jgi:tRNA pseudouridine38-40 synthase
MGLAHYKIILAYNGSAFAGFQRQAEARTVQAEFETALKKIGWEGTHILGAGRTDAGVHARGQVVSFQLDWGHTTEDLGNALNHYLPRDMAVNAVSEVGADFHPRYDAKAAVIVTGSFVSRSGIHCAQTLPGGFGPRCRSSG